MRKDEMISWLREQKKDDDPPPTDYDDSASWNYPPSKVDNRAHNAAIEEIILFIKSHSDGR